MNVLQRFMRGLASLATRYGGQSISGAEDGSIFRVGQQTTAGEFVSEETAMTISAVYAAVEIRSSLKASLPLGVYRKTGDRKEPATMHPALRVLSTQPNAEMTPKHFWQTLEMHKLLWGNCYAEITWDGGGNVRELWPLEPWRVRPYRDPPGTGELYFKVDGHRVIHDRDLLRSPHLSYDGVCGRSVITWARESLGLSIAAQTYGSTFFGNGGVPSGVLEHPGRLPPETRKQMRKEWREVHAPIEGGRNNEVAVLWEGMKYNRISLPPGDAQFLDTRKFQVTEVARWFNVPPHMLRDLERATFSNIEHQQIEFVVYSLLPGLIEWEQEIDRKLLTPPNLYSKHAVRGLLRGDLKTQADFFGKMFGIGVYGINDIKDLLDENPIGEDGDRHFIPLNMVDISKIDEMMAAKQAVPGGSAVPAPTEPGADEADDEENPDDGAGGDTGSEGRDGLGTKVEGVEKVEESKGKDAACGVVQDSSTPLTASTSSTPPLAAQIAREFLADTMGRMIRKEVKEITRLAGDPKTFLPRVDAFYERHIDVLTSALERPAAAIAIAGECDIDVTSAAYARTLATLHVKRSQVLLLEASECQAAELSAKVAACMAKWEVDRSCRGVSSQSSVVSRDDAPPNPAQLTTAL